MDFLAWEITIQKEFGFEKLDILWIHSLPVPYMHRQAPTHMHTAAFFGADVIL